MSKLCDLMEGYRTIVRGLVKNAEEKVGKSGPYVNIVFTDGDQEISANMFVTIDRFPFKGKVVDLTLTIRNGYINVLNAMEVVNADKAEFLPHAPIDADEAWKFIMNVICSMEDHPDIRVIVKRILSKYEEDFKKWSAAKSGHHNYVGGLIYHVYRMLQMAQGTVRAYDGLDAELLYAGVILHDIGKLEELQTDDVGNAVYTVNGNLFGHLYLGMKIIDDSCRAMGIDENKEDIMLLKHMIGSHHKELEYGAIRKPATLEAYVLSALDEMDSRYWIYEHESETIETGTCSEPIRVLNGTIVYKKN